MTHHWEKQSESHSIILVNLISSVLRNQYSSNTPPILCFLPTIEFSNGLCQFMLNIYTCSTFTQCLKILALKEITVNKNYVCKLSSNGNILRIRNYTCKWNLHPLTIPIEGKALIPLSLLKSFLEHASQKCLKSLTYIILTI